jgi:hypothetical protein
MQTVSQKIREKTSPLIALITLICTNLKRENKQGELTRDDARKSALEIPDQRHQ